MTRNRTFRPRVSREQRDRLVEAATIVNGEEPAHGFHHALQLLTRHFEVLAGNPDTCPDCGAERVTDTSVSETEYYCKSCESHFDALDYVDPADRDRAQLPGLSLEDRHRSKTTVEESEDRPGTKQGENTSDRLEEWWQDPSNTPL